MTKPRILILGGTTEARRLAESLAGREDLDTTLSLAGRTLDPLIQPVPVRIGGFGGSDGLARYLETEAIDLLVDATHPFANRISANAAVAAKSANVAAIALRRPAWRAVDGDRWHPVSSMPEAASALGSSPRRAFLSIGRQEAHHFNSAPQHSYLIRSIDPVDPPLQVPDATYILSAGPFTLESEQRLLKDRKIDIIVTKNSGGEATYAKIEAARLLGLDVIMIERVEVADMLTFEIVETALVHIDHFVSPAVKRGV
jgi:precorrin-6A/cobalt-precorrin-6A reductase